MSSICDSTPTAVATCSRRLGEIGTKQLALVDARVTAQDRDATAAPYDRSQQMIKRFALASTPEECCAARTV
jgi:hypothetical protein